MATRTDQFIATGEWPRVNERAWRLLRQTVGDDPKLKDEWIKQVHDEAARLLEAIYDYGQGPAPFRWVALDEVAVSLRDLLCGTMR